MSIDGAYAFAGAVTGLVVGMTGVGAGALMTPMLLLFFSVAPTTAIATDLWFAVVTKLAAAGIHGRQGQVDWMVVKRLWWGSLPASAAVVAFVALNGNIAKVTWLTQAIGVLVVLTSLGLLFSPQLMRIARESHSNHPLRLKKQQSLLTVLSGAGLGFCVALTSVGAGALGAVLLTYLYPTRLTPHRLVATDIVHAIPLAMVAGFGYLLAGLVDWAMLASLLAGSIPGVVVGSLFAQRVSGSWIRVGLAAVLLLAGIKMLL